jgi:hypothetical protein
VYHNGKSYCGIFLYDVWKIYNILKKEGGGESLFVILSNNNVEWKILSPEANESCGVEKSFAWF